MHEQELLDRGGAESRRDSLVSAAGKPVPVSITSLSHRWQGIQEYNGGAVLGMAGKNCVAVACDMRYGAQMQTMAIDKNKVFKMHDR